MAKIIGIDVSTHNGTMDWAAIKKAGVEFAIIRAGYGRYQVDSQFTNNITGALAQGIPVGIYWFSYALDAAGAAQEAQKCIDTIKGYDVTLPVFFDFEYDTIRYAKEQGVTLGKTAFNAHAVAFCETIKAAGYTPGVYYNLDYYRRFVDTAKLRGYVQWYAQYASSASIDGWDLWQYTSSGTFSGVSGTFDVNILENTDLLTGGGYTGWDEVNGERVYYVDNELVKGFKTIDGKNYYFDQSTGYLWHDRYNWYNGAFWYFDEEGIYTMIADRTFYFDKDGNPVEVKESVHYNTLGEVTSDTYRATLEKLISKGILRGREGTAEDLVLDLSEEAVRVLVMLDRARVFG